MEQNDFIQYAMLHTQVLRFPEQKLATFGITKINYFIITEPIINELIEGEEGDLVVREGTVIAERPKIITPYYLNNLFPGFEHGEEYTSYVREQSEYNNPGLLYKYRNEFEKMEVVSDPIELVIEKLEKELEKKSSSLTAIIKGVNHYWDVSLMKFIFELTTSSLVNNIMDLNRRGLLTVDKQGVPKDARLKIENLFRDAKKGTVDPALLKKELDCWGLFREYENRFLDLFIKK